MPSTATATTGLTSPDGILGVLPPGDVPSGVSVPSGATAFLYIDKQVNYFIPSTLSSSVALPITDGTVKVSGDPTTNFGTGPNTYYVADNNGVYAVNCSGASSTELTGCTSASGTPTTTISSGNDVGGPGACSTPGSVLRQIGEGSLKGKTLFKNNEDCAAVRMAYTTNGTSFTDITPAGVITGLGRPTAQTGFRWIAPGGTVVQNPEDPSASSTARASARTGTVTHSVQSSARRRPTEA